MKKSTIGKILLVTGGVAAAGVVTKILTAIDWKDVGECCDRQFRRILGIDIDLPKDDDSCGLDDDCFYEDDIDLDDPDPDPNQRYIVIPPDTPTEACFETEVTDDEVDAVKDTDSSSEE